MNKKVVSLLLTLAMCMGLAVPAFAEELEETPISQEIETVQTEEVPALPDLSEEGETEPEKVTYPEEIVSSEEVTVPDEEGSAVWVWEKDDEGNGYLRPASEEELGVLESQSATLGNDGISPQASHPLPHLLDMKETTRVETTSSSHRTVTVRVMECIYSGCDYKLTEEDPGDWEPHSLDYDGYQGSNYHKGTLHYVGYQYHCAMCGYIKTQYESTPCPGNNNGVGCVFSIVNKVEPPDEVESTNPTEDVTEPEETEESTAVDMYQKLMTFFEEAATPEETKDLFAGEEEFVEAGCEHGHNVDYEYEELFEELGEIEKHTVKVTFWVPCDGSCQDSMFAKEAPVTTLQTTIYCPNCGNRNWDNGYVESAGYRIVDEDTHILEGTMVFNCQSCGINVGISAEWEKPHSWVKGSFEGYQSNGATGHAAVHSYSCVCGKTKTEPGVTESHSMDYDGYKGDNYHKGLFHYVGYQYHCTVCGYTETRYDSTRCPGNDNGVGCIFSIVNKVEPPVEVESTNPTEDITEPEDVAEPEDVTEPEETIVPEETTEPEEVAEPEETEVPEEANTPEEADIPEEVETLEEPTETEEPEDVTEPEDVVEPEDVTEPEDVVEPEETTAPEETVEPEEPILPEEPTIPEDPAGPGETAVPGDGESVE